MLSWSTDGALVNTVCRVVEEAIMSFLRSMKDAQGQDKRANRKSILQLREQVRSSAASKADDFLC
eukprot:663603-Lingulodinium_polyedra.AAC.1